MDKDVKFYMIKRTERGAMVYKFGAGVEDDYEKEAEYEISSGACTCKGFAFQSTCKHLKMLDTPVVGRPVPLKIAREEVRRLTQDFGEDFRFAGLPEEPYERDRDGNVTCATVIFRGPRYRPELFGEGVWEGVLKESGLKVRMMVEEY